MENSILERRRTMATELDTAPRKAGEVEIAANRLDDKIEVLVQKIKTIHERLRMVLAPSNEKGKKDTRAMLSTELGEKLARLDDKIQMANGQLANSDAKQLHDNAAHNPPYL
jgi:uncharacterized protein YfkK (UPF0435 family)